jgi:hypothetical protein
VIGVRKGFSRTFGEARPTIEGYLLSSRFLRLFGSPVLPVDLFAGAELRLEDLVQTPITAVALLVAKTQTAACPRY